MTQVMAVGDSFNDVDMIKAAGLGVATGNAKGPVKNLADAVTDANTQDGVAKAIDRYCYETETGEDNG